MAVRIIATVRNTGSVPVLIQVRGIVETPAGGRVFSQWSNSVELKKGQSKQFNITVPTTPTVAGTWKAIVEVYDLLDKKVIRTASKSFAVTKSVEVTIDSVTII